MELMPRVLRVIRAEMRGHRGEELSVPQFRSLAAIGRNEGASLSDVAEQVGLTLSSMSKLIEGLVARRLVTREESPEDRRRLVLALTPEGRSLLASARAATHARLSEILQTLSESELAQVEEALTLLRPLFDETSRGPER